MAELAPKSDRTNGVYARVHAAQKRLPALIFVSPDFSSDDKHPEHYLQYYPHAEIIKLPFGADEARATILNRIALGIAKGEKTHTILIGAHGSPDTMAIGGALPEGQTPQQKEKPNVVGVVSLLSDIAALRKGKRPIADNIILSSCDILANASPERLNQMASLPKLLGANLIASSNTTFTTAIYGKGDNYSTPVAGRFYQITKAGHFVPYFDFRDEWHLKLGDKETLRDGLSMSLVEKRAALDANCSTNTTASCAAIKKDYEVFAAYAALRDRLSKESVWKFSPDEAKKLAKPLEAMVPKLPPAERISVLRNIAELHPFGSNEHRNALTQSLDLIMSGALQGDASNISYNMNVLTYADTIPAFKRNGTPQFALSVAQKLADIKGLPSDDQMNVWQAVQKKDWKRVSHLNSGEAVSATARDTFHTFEHDLSLKLNDDKYSLADRAKAAQIILSSESPNDELKAAAQRAVECDNNPACSDLSAIKRSFLDKPDAPKEHPLDKKTDTNPQKAPPRKLTAPAAP